MRVFHESVLGVHVNIEKREKVLEKIEKYIKEFRMQNSEFRKKGKKPLLIFTPNPEIIAYAVRHPYFKKIVNSAQINIPDGHGIGWAGKLLLGKTVPITAGIDLLENLCLVASRKAFRIGLIGGKKNVAVDALECLTRRYPRLKGRVFDAPEIGIEDQNRISYIVYRMLQVLGYTKYDPPAGGPNTKYRIVNTTGDQLQETMQYVHNLAQSVEKEEIDILFVALGHPKQEYFASLLAAAYGEGNRPLVIMTVGGAFDYLAGRVSRAPVSLRQYGFEWLYRLIQQPWRIGRQLRGGMFFLWVVREWVRRKITKWY